MMLCIDLFLLMWKILLCEFDIFVLIMLDLIIFVVVTVRIMLTKLWIGTCGYWLLVSETDSWKSHKVLLFMYIYYIELW